jgi:branched-chain amino acid aminotransferase
VAGGSIKPGWRAADVTSGKQKKPALAKTDLPMMTGEPQKIPPAGMSLAVSPYRLNTLSPLSGIRSLNYLEQVLSWEEAQARDFDEAVMLNERGEIVLSDDG